MKPSNRTSRPRGTITQRRRAKRAQLFARRRKAWTPFRGQDFDYPERSVNMAVLLRALDGRGRLGRVIVNAGSGADSPDDPFMYANLRKDRKLIRIDIAFPKFPMSPRGLDLRADIEHVAPDTFAQRRRLIQAARFLGVDPRSTQPPVDTILFSHVLNYVNFRETIQGLTRYLKSGGRIIVFNRPRFGFSHLFSDHGVKSNAVLINFLKKSGFEIEHATLCTQAGLYPQIKSVGPNDFIILVARKK